MRSILPFAAPLACALCAACAASQAPAPQTAQAAMPQPECRDFTVPVTVGGQPVQATGTACRQPDDSWRVTQETPGLPTQSYVIPPPPYPYGPYYYAPYFGAGIGASFFFGGFGHDRFFHHQGHFRHM